MILKTFAIRRTDIYHGENVFVGRRVEDVEHNIAYIIKYCVWLNWDYKRSSYKSIKL